jgi:hypothetical protein
VNSANFALLDFSHSGAKGVGYARHRNQPKEVISRCVPYHPRWYRLWPPSRHFSKRVFRHVQVLVAGAILAPGKRTVANWYGSEQRTVEIASQTAVWYSTGLPAVPVRWYATPKESSKPKPSFALTSMPIRSR